MYLARTDETHCICLEKPCQCLGVCAHAFFYTGNVKLKLSSVFYCKAEALLCWNSPVSKVEGCVHLPFFIWLATALHTVGGVSCSVFQGLSLLIETFYCMHKSSSNAFS